MFFVLTFTEQASATDPTDPQAVNGTDTSGLIDTNDVSGTITVTVDTDNGNTGTGTAIVLGADATSSVATSEATTATAIAVNVTSTNGVADVTFAGDLVLNGNAGDTITVTATTNNNMIFQGNATVTTGSTISIVGGNGADTLALTFDTANAENLVIDSTVTASAAGDTITMNVNNSQGGGNTIAFSKAIGATAAIDVLAIGASTTATFSSTVVADSITIASANTTAFNDDVTGALSINAAGTVSVAVDKTISGNVLAGTDGQGTLTFATATIAKTLVGGTVGAASGNALLVLNVATGAGITSTFASTVDARTINITGTGTVALNGSVTAATKLDFGADATVNLSDGANVTGAITNTTTNNGTLNVAGTSTFSAAVGSTGTGLLAVNILGSGKTATFSDNLTAGTTTISNGATLKFSKAAMSRAE
jgi:hypothetical protein